MKTRLPLALVLCLLPVAAHAHPGHDAAGFQAGVAHPVTGLDHILAMVAVGLWSVQLGGRARWAVPASFVLTMLAGGALGMAHLPLPFVEQGILASVLVLGILIMLATRLPMAACMAIVASFALFHGHAHGAEMPDNATGAAYGAGFVLATAALHLAGIAAGSLIAKAADARWIRWAGAAVLAGGVMLQAV